MSILACSYCGDFADTDSGEGHWDVKRVRSTRILDFVCGCCVEKYVNEDGELDPNLEEERAMHDKGEALAAMAEDMA
jgi:hypothetical protein